MFNKTMNNYYSLPNDFITALARKSGVTILLFFRVIILRIFMFALFMLMFFIHNIKYPMKNNVNNIKPKQKHVKPFLEYFDLRLTTLILLFITH